uniref:Uncharacterized protein TCIL3000_10_11530 n=1 Tax=Trypanosoma congolense (strain IL3000) TaxID=1068625 RepID=G0UYA5_TRYCI|nr:unnamed protein product [Trypanosoma congolense IL3000]
MAAGGDSCLDKFFFYAKAFRLLDYIIIVSAALIIVYTMKSFQPFCRPFSWKDRTISYLKKSSTYPAVALYLIDFLPCAIFAVVEGIRALLAAKGEWYLDVQEPGPEPNALTCPVEMVDVDTVRREAISDGGPVPYLKELPEAATKRFSGRFLTFLEVSNYWILAHGFSIILSICIVEMLKVYVGQLRPDFLDRLRKKGYNSSSTNVDWCKLEGDGRRSFPSGHSSCAFSGLTPLALYFLALMRAFRGGSLVRPIIGLGPLYFAFVVAGSRVRDNRHHTSDIIAGSIIGFVSGIFSVKLLFRFSEGKAYLVPRRLEFASHHNGRIVADKA